RLFLVSRVCANICVYVFFRQNGFFPFVRSCTTTMRHIFLLPAIVRSATERRTRFPNLHARPSFSPFSRRYAADVTICSPTQSSLSLGQMKKRGQGTVSCLVVVDVVNACNVAARVSAFLRHSIVWSGAELCCTASMRWRMQLLALCNAVEACVCC